MSLQTLEPKKRNSVQFDESNSGRFKNQESREQMLHSAQFNVADMSLDIGNSKVAYGQQTQPFKQSKKNKGDQDRNKQFKLKQGNLLLQNNWNLTEIDLIQKEKQGLAQVLNYLYKTRWFWKQKYDIDSFNDTKTPLNVKAPLKKWSLLVKVRECAFMIFLILMIIILISFEAKKLGTLVSTTFETERVTEIILSGEQISKQIPLHHLLWLNQEKVKERMRCTIYGQCDGIDSQICQVSNELTSSEYELCMVDGLLSKGQNATLFCEYHYSNGTIWEDSNLIPETQAFIKRKYQCFEKSGVPLGKAYCDEMDSSKYSQWAKDELYKCYEEQGVDYARDYCQYMFPLDEPEVENSQSYANCMRKQGQSPYDQYYCNAVYSELQDKINCYDLNQIKSYEVCMAKMAKSKEEETEWTSQQLIECFQDAGYTVNQEFCEQNNQNVTKMYKCYDNIGLNIGLDREFCELKNLNNSQSKYDCVGQEIFGILKGAEFCSFSYNMPSQYEQRTSCLETQGIDKDSQYCREKYDYIEANTPDIYNETERFQCYNEYNIPSGQNQESCEQLVEYSRPQMTIEQGELGTISESSDELSQDMELNFFKFFQGLTQHTEVWNEDDYLHRRLHIEVNGWGYEEFGNFSLFDVYQEVGQNEAGSWDWNELRSLILQDEDIGNIWGDDQSWIQGEEHGSRRLLKAKKQSTRNLRRLDETFPASNTEIGPNMSQSSGQRRMQAEGDDCQGVETVSSDGLVTTCVTVFDDGQTATTTTNITTCSVNGRGQTSCSWATSYSEGPSASFSSDPDFDPYYGACTDDLTAVDSYDDGCDWYALNQESCGDYDFENFTASEACCACGSGTLVSTESIENDGGSVSTIKIYSNGTTINSTFSEGETTIITINVDGSRSTATIFSSVVITQTTISTITGMYCDYQKEVILDTTGSNSNWTTTITTNTDCTVTNRTVDIDGYTMISLTYPNGTVTNNVFGAAGHRPHDCENVQNETNQIETEPTSSTTFVQNGDCSYTNTTIYSDGRTQVTQFFANGTTISYTIGMGSATRGSRVGRVGDGSGRGKRGGKSGKVQGQKVLVGGKVQGQKIQVGGQKVQVGGKVPQGSDQLSLGSQEASELVVVEAETCETSRNDTIDEFGSAETLELYADCTFMNRTIDFDGLTLLTITYPNGTYTYNEFGTGGHFPHNCTNNITRSHNDSDHSDTQSIQNEDCSWLISTIYPNGTTIVNETLSNGTSYISIIGQGSGTLSIEQVQEIDCSAYYTQLAQDVPWQFDPFLITGKWHFRSSTMVHFVFDEVQDHPYSNVLLEIQMSGPQLFDISFYNKDDKSTVICQKQIDFGADNMKLNSYAESLFSNEYQELIQYDKFKAYFVNGEEDAAYPVWWKNSFYNPQNVTSIKMLNYVNGEETSLLPGAAIYIGNTLCASVPDDILENQIMYVDCVDQNGDKVTEGINGDFIKFEVMTRAYGILPITGLEILSFEVDRAKEIAIDFGLTTCSSSEQEACIQAFSQKDEGNSKWNCLQMYGVENRTAQYCLDMDSSNRDPYNYQLYNKYQCLIRPPNQEFARVKVDESVSRCLRLYYEYQVERCLKEYEQSLVEGPGFTGTGQIDSDSYYSQYGGKTAAQQMATGSSSQRRQLNDTVISESEIEDFLCQKASMSFFSCPNCLQSNQNITQNLKCEVQVIQSKDKDFSSSSCSQIESEYPQLLVHFFLDDGTLQGNITVKKSELNQQYLSLIFDKDVQGITVQNGQIYMQSSDPGVEQPRSLRGRSLTQLFESSKSIKLHEYESYNIGQISSEKVQIPASILKNESLNSEPKRKFLGLSTQYETQRSKSVVLSQATSQRVNSNTQQQRLSQNTYFSWSFDIEKMTFKYYSTSDFLQDLGGYGYSLYCVIYVIASFLVVLYLIDMVKLIQHKYQEQEKFEEMDSLIKKLPYYKQVVEEQIENGFSEVLQKDLQSIESLMSKQSYTYDHSNGLFVLQKLEIQEREKKGSDDLMEGGQQTINLSQAGASQNEKVIQDEFEILKNLDKMYGEHVKELDDYQEAEMFDDSDVKSLVLSARLKYNFFRIVDLIRKRASIFGIYALNDKVELNQLQLIHLKAQLQTAINLIIEHTNELSSNQQDTTKPDQQAKLLQKFQKQIKEVEQKLKQIDTTQQDILLMHEDAYKEEQKMISEIGVVKKTIESIQYTQGQFESKLDMSFQSQVPRTLDDRPQIVVTADNVDEIATNQVAQNTMGYQNQFSKQYKQQAVLQKRLEVKKQLSNADKSQAQESSASFNNLQFQKNEGDSQKDATSALGSVNDAEEI